MKKIKRVIIVVSSIILSIFLITGVLALSAFNYGRNTASKLPKHQNVTHYEMETIKAIGKGLYDKNGNYIQLKGVNFGNWLIQEGWMSVNSIGVKKNEDGSYNANSEGVIDGYYEVYQEEFDDALKNNPNLTDNQIEELMDVYYKSYCQEEDFINIKNIGFNMIRLPMYYRNFMEGSNDNLTMKENAFELVDWFLEMAKKHDLYVILDMHGVVGGQSGNEHSGTRDCLFWENSNYQQSMCELWQNIALHYKNERADLASTIAAFDLVNEPSKDKENTDKVEWEVMDKLYDAIREVDKDHVIAIESCWDFSNLPSTKKYGWENVMYEYHFYNWNSQTINNDIYYTMNFLTQMFNEHNVPIYIGEFTFFEQKDEWIKWLNEYDRRGFNWSIWNYKIVSTGWWDNSWGIYVFKMELRNYQEKLNIKTATYDEIYAVWSNLSTSKTYNSTGILMKSLKEYFETCKTY